jgi:hypothetical protein
LRTRSISLGHYAALRFVFDICGNIFLRSAFLTEITFLFAGKHKSKKLAIALGVSFSFVSLVILILGLFWYRKKRQHGAILYIGGRIALEQWFLS